MSKVLNMICIDCGAWFPHWEDDDHRKDCLDCGGELHEN